MPCDPKIMICSMTYARRAVRLATLLLLSTIQRPALAQLPPSSQGVPPNRAPSISLVVPAAGLPIPADKPVVLLRFVAVDSTDAIDPSSLLMLVDGQDRTSLLQVGGGEAWGPLAPDSSLSLPLAIAIGVHLLHVRICSVRGICGALDAAITVIPAAPKVEAGTPSASDSTTQRGSSASLIRMLLELVLALARKLTAR